MATKAELLNAELMDEKYKAVSSAQVVDTLNNPVQTGTEVTYATVSADDWKRLVSAASAARLVDTASSASPAEPDATRDAAVAFDAFWETGVDVTPGGPCRAILDQLVAGGIFSAAEVDAIVAAGTTETPVLQNWWQTNGTDNVRVSEVVSIREAK